MDAGEFAKHLYAEDKLSRKQLDEIRRLQYHEPTRAADTMIECLLSGNVRHVMDSLTKNGQHHVRQLLALEGDCTVYLFCCKKT